MTKLQLGPVGVVVGRPGDRDVFVAAAAELAELGYSTIWLAGPQRQHLDQIGNLVRATRDIQVASGIISVDRFDPAAVVAAQAATDAGRLPGCPRHPAPDGPGSRPHPGGPGAPHAAAGP